MREDQHTINTKTAYKLLVTQSSSSVSKTKTYSGAGTCYWGIRVWKISSSGTETEITSGTPVAQVSRSGSGSGMQSNTWSCPETSFNATDALLVRVYVRKGGGAWTNLAEFVTIQLKASLLSGGTWTVYYWTSHTYIVFVDTLSVVFRFGTSTNNSRIDGTIPYPEIIVPLKAKENSISLFLK